MKRFAALTAALSLFLLCAINPAPPLTKAAVGTSAVYCVGCRVIGGCWACSSPGQANYCPAVDCGNCTSSGVCLSGGDGPGAGDVPEGEGGLESIRLEKNFKLSTATIREIAAVHPRFAATLARLNKLGLTESVYSSNWTPAELTTRDVEAFLEPDGSSSNLLKKFNKRARKINRLIEKGEVAPIVYRITIGAGDLAAQQLTLQVLNSSPVDPPYSTLKVGLVNKGMSLSAKPRTEWTIE